MRACAPARYGRPTRYTGGKMAPRRVWLPSTIEATGRTMSCTWSDRRQGWVIGVDVAMPSVWSRSSHIFTNYGAGGAWSGSDLDTAYKKSPWAAEFDVDAHWMSGSNGNGGVYRRLAADTAWTNQTTTYYGQVDEGGSNNPRSAGSRLGCRVGVRTFLSCTKAAGRGIAKADTLGGSWADWAFGTSRQYTAIVPSIPSVCTDTLVAFEMVAHTGDTASASAQR